MLNKTKSYIREHSSAESGIALVEALIATIIILIVLVATAAGLSSSFGASSSSQNRNKATQLINSQIAIAKQAPYAKLGLATPTGSTTGCNNWSTSYNGEQEVIITAPFKSLSYCQTKQYGGVGITFYIETQVTYVVDAGFNGSSENVAIIGTHYNPKRVTVTVRWNETADSSGAAVTSSVKASWIQTPTISDCIPPGLNIGSSNPSECN